MGGIGLIGVRVAPFLGLRLMVSLVTRVLVLVNPYPQALRETAVRVKVAIMVREVINIIPGLFLWELEGLTY